MAVNAFKSKYSGEEIEKLLDKIKENDSGTMTTTAHPYTTTEQYYETDNMIITSNHIDTKNGYGAEGFVKNIIFDNTESIYRGNHSDSSFEFHITHEFKNDIKVKIKGVHLRVKESSNWGNVYFKSYYVDPETQEEILFNTITWTLSGANIKVFDINITEELPQISKIITRCLLNGSMQYFVFDFE